MNNETYAMTEAERTQLVVALGIHPDFDGDSSIDQAIEMLQSLPLITGAPVRYEYQARSGLWFPFTDQRHHDNTVADGTYPIRPLYTHAQPLQPITAEDITGQMHAEWNEIFKEDDTFLCPTDGAIMAAAVNAWIKHKGGKQ